MKSLICSRVKIVSRRERELGDTHYTVELAALVTLWSAEMILALASTELSEVLGRLRDNIGKELELYSSERLAWCAR
jgi:hypothetical protein